MIFPDSKIPLPFNKLSFERKTNTQWYKQKIGGARGVMVIVVGKWTRRHEFKSFLLQL